MKTFRIIFILVSSVTLCQGQSFNIDSLQQLAPRLKGISRAEVLNQLAWALVSYDLNKSKEIVQQAYQLSKSLGYKKGMAEALIYEAYCDFTVGNDQTAIQKFKNSIALSESDGQDTLKGFALSYMARVYQNIDQLDSSLYCLNESYKVLKDSLHPYYLSFTYLVYADHYSLLVNEHEQFRYLEKSLRIREKLKDKRPLIYACERMSTYFINRGDYNRALHYIDQAQVALGQDTVDNEEINVIKKEKSLIFIKQGQYKQALDLLNRVIKFYEKNSFTKELANLYYQVGYALVEFDNFEAGLKNYFKALSIAEQKKYHLERCKILVEIGRVYHFLDQNDMAFDFTSKALSLARKYKHLMQEAGALNLLGVIDAEENRLKEAYLNLTQALAIREAVNDRSGQAGTLYNLAQLCEKQNDYQRALQFHQKSLAIEVNLNHSIGISYSYQGIAQLLIKMRDYDQAGYYLSQGEKLAKQIGSGKILVDIYKSRRDLNMAQANYKEAISYAKLYDELKDSIFSENMSARMGALQNTFELEKRDNAILTLQQQQKLQEDKFVIQEAQIKQQKLIIWFAVSGFIAIAFIAFIIYKYYHRVKTLNQAIIERNEEIQSQAEELSEANDILSNLNIKISEQAEALLKSNQTIQKINESLEERIDQRTAELLEANKELDMFLYRSSHDFRRPLTTFMGIAEIAKITIKDPEALNLFQKVNETAHTLDRMLAKLQSISTRAEDELIYGKISVEELLSKKISLFSQTFISENIHVHMQVEPGLYFYSYLSLVKIVMYNLIENAIVYKIEDNANIKISAYQQQDQIVIEIEDNGQGIDEAQLPKIFDMFHRGNENSKGNGLGLYIVKKCVDKLKANISLQSVPGKGTIVILQFPTELSSISKLKTNQ